MYQTTLDYLDAHNAVWNAVPIIGKYKNALSAINMSIKTAAADQADAQVFIGKSLSALKKTIAAKMDILDDMLEAYAVDTDNAELTERANNAKSDYFRLPNEDFEIKVKQVIGLLETLSGCSLQLHLYILRHSSMSSLKKQQNILKRRYNLA